MAVFFTSDHHFGQATARSFYRRPFASAAEMHTAMMERWNAVVRPEDEVWHLGDFAVRLPAHQVRSLLASLNGRKHLLVGNNDDAAVTECDAWHSIQAYAELVLDDRRLVLCHYPFRTWREMGRGAINLHGHSHGRLRPLPRQFDVGVDAWDFRPVHLSEILTRASAPVSAGRPAQACK